MLHCFALENEKRRLSHLPLPFIHLNLPPTKGCGGGDGSLCVGVFLFLYVCVISP